MFGLWDRPHSLLINGIGYSPEWYHSHAWLTLRQTTQSTNKWYKVLTWVISQSCLADFETDRPHSLLTNGIGYSPQWYHSRAWLTLRQRDRPHSLLTNGIRYSPEWYHSHAWLTLRQTTQSTNKWYKVLTQVILQSCLADFETDRPHRLTLRQRDRQHSLLTNGIRY